MIESLKCSFCGKGQKEVSSIIAGGDVFICGGCVWVCVQILLEAKSVFGFPALESLSQDQERID